jgi:uncharacterized protein (TIGR02246 family)
MSADERAIREVMDTWLAATAAGDTARVLTLMADDVVFLTPGRPPFGREVFEAAARAPGQAPRVQCAGDLEEVVVVGDFAYARARLTVTVTPPGGQPEHRAGHTLSIFRKRSDGQWVLARDANLVVPAASVSS